MVLSIPRIRTRSRNSPLALLTPVLVATLIGGCASAPGSVSDTRPAAELPPTVAPNDAASAPLPSAVPDEDVVPTDDPAASDPVSIEGDLSPEPGQRTRRRPISVSLFQPREFVAQYTFEWCVGASLQMTLNIATDRDSDSRARQKRLWEMAQARSNSPWGGANPVGWTATLNDLGVGPYVLVSIPEFDDAVRLAASAIKQTKRPVGLVMWQGRHAWLMTGFESRGDPTRDDRSRVTGVRVVDPLYPYGSSVWGASPRPGTLMKPARLAKQFVFREYGRTDLGVPPGYLLVLPTRAGDPLAPAISGAAPRG